MKETFPNLEESDVLEAPHFIDGLKYVKENIIEKGKNVIPVEDIWILLDTHGIFPELTEKLAANLGAYQTGCRFIRRYLLKFL